jgi:photosystem II stability/assembly factor-like uncharacterized protein
MKRLVLIAAAVLAVPSAVGSAQPETWTVRCISISAPWSDVTTLASVNGGFNFVDKDGREVRTSAGMNCWAIKNGAKVG